MTALTLVVNGGVRAFPAATTVADVVATLTAQRRGVAVAVNGEVVPRSGWSARDLRAGDRVEVLTAAQGG